MSLVHKTILHNIMVLKVSCENAWIWNIIHGEMNISNPKIGTNATYTNATRKTGQQKRHKTEHSTWPSYQVNQ